MVRYKAWESVPIVLALATFSAKPVIISRLGILESALEKYSAKRRRKTVRSENLINRVTLMFCAHYKNRKQIKFLLVLYNCYLLLSLYVIANFCLSQLFPDVFGGNTVPGKVWFWASCIIMIINALDRRWSK